MDLEQLYKTWAEDSVIEPGKMSEAVILTASLHAKYMEMASRANLRLRKLRAEHKMLVAQKTDWYKGEMAEEDMKALGWPPNPLRILRADVAGYVDRDPDVIKKTLQVGGQEEVAEFLQNCLKHINGRSFLIRDYIEWEKFKSGG